MSDDPIRWAEGGGPPGGAELVRSLRRAPPLPPELRRMPRPHRAGRAPAPRWIGAALASAVIVGGLLLWVLRDRGDAPPANVVADPYLALVATPDDAGTREAEVTAAIDDPAPAAIAAPAPEEAPARPRPRGPRSVRGDYAEEVAEEVAEEITEEAPAPTDAPRYPVPAPPSETGFLFIQSLPWARVWIDGVDTGLNTPVRRMRVDAGRHTISLVPSDGSRHDFVVEVPPGETVRIVRQL